MLSTRHHHTTTLPQPDVGSSITSSGGRYEVISDKYDDVHLQDIAHLAESDVEMQAPPSDEDIFIVLDTNVLLSYCGVLQQFVDDVERAGLPVKLIIPGVVVMELDSQKTNPRLALLARFATRWLLEKTKERRSVKSQANKETMKRTGNWRVAEVGEDPKRRNDQLILDCCLYWTHAHNHHTNRHIILCTGDNNLCLEAESSCVRTLSPFPGWSSQAFAREIYNIIGYDFNDYARSLFGEYRESYQGLERLKKSDKPKSVTNYTPIDEDISMDIDDDASQLLLLPSHALDLLHMQVVDYFTQLLRELSYRTDEQYRQTRAYESIHGRKRPPGMDQVWSWNAGDCLGFLDQDGRNSVSFGQLANFLSRRGQRGARPGQEWTRAQWNAHVQALRTLATLCSDNAILVSLEALQPHIDGVWALKLRPTGT